MVPRLEHFAKSSKVGFLERSRVAVPEVMKKRWCRSPVKDGEVFQPKLNVLEGGYRILKDM